MFCIIETREKLGNPTSTTYLQLNNLNMHSVSELECTTHRCNNLFENLISVAFDQKKQFIPRLEMPGQRAGLTEATSAQFTSVWSLTCNRNHGKAMMI